MPLIKFYPGSLSARRAWIEIIVLGGSIFTLLVALRKESVDRNSLLCGLLSMLTRSLSARRAWIEMYDVSLNYKEVLCRSPQGERG